MQNGYAKGNVGQLDPFLTKSRVFRGRWISVRDYTFRAVFWTVKTRASPSVQH
jgi:hypothetical protein